MIIGIAGRKQSGKNTVANIINGEFLKNKELIQDYKIDQDGQLVIKTTDANSQEGWGIFDVTRRDNNFKSYAELEIWPYVKIYHFADPLKAMAMELFDLTEKQVYGSNDDKNTMTPYGKTSREFLQYLGTDVMRKIKDSIWVDYTIKLIKDENSEISIIPDVRFPNEVKAIKEADGVVVRLTRDPYKSKHECESSLDKDTFDWRTFDKVINNHDTSIEKLKSDVIDLMKGML